MYDGGEYKLAGTSEVLTDLSPVPCETQRRETAEASVAMN